MFDDIRLKRREALIKELKGKIEELEKQKVDEKKLKDKEIEMNTLIYQLTELLNKMSKEMKELEEAKHNYEIERFKFVRLNAEYKKKMQKFLKQFDIKEEPDSDNRSE